MCRYCSVLQEKIKKDNFLLKRCIIALNWKENKELVKDIFKTIGGEEICITHLEEQQQKQNQST